MNDQATTNYQDDSPDYDPSPSVPSRRPRSGSSYLENPVASKNKRVTIEEAEDEEDYLRDGRYFEQYLDAGKPLREGQTNFEQYQQYQEEEGEDEWAPFGDA